MARAAWWLGAVLRFVLLPILGIAAMTWWLIGDQSTIGSDHILQVPLLQNHPRLVGATGVALLIVFAVDLFRTRTVAPRRYAIGVLPPVALGGIATGYAGRLITAQVHGANIGGGLAIMFGPLFLFAMVAWACAMLGGTVTPATTTELSQARR